MEPERLTFPSRRLARVTRFSSFPLFDKHLLSLARPPAATCAFNNVHARPHRRSQGWLAPVDSWPRPTHLPSRHALALVPPGNAQQDSEVSDRGRSFAYKLFEADQHDDGGVPTSYSPHHRDPTAEWMRKGGMPNNLQLADPRLQDRASDLLGVQGTEAVRAVLSSLTLVSPRHLFASARCFRRPSRPTCRSGTLYKHMLIAHLHRSRTAQVRRSSRKPVSSLPSSRRGRRATSAEVHAC